MNLMKNKLILLFTVIGVVFMCSCESDDEHKPHGADGNAPGEPVINEVIPTPGGAIIYYSAPEDIDVLYIQAVFTDNKNRLREVKSSPSNDSLVIEGLGEVAEYNIGVSAVDRGENESNVTEVKVTPLTPPVRLISPSLVGEVDYGGIKVSYENPSRAEVSLNIVSENESGEMIYRESFFTSQLQGSYSFRGYSAVRTRFGVYVEDRWENVSDTTYFEVTPIPDEFLDKDNFSVFKIQGDEDFNDYGFNEGQMFDNRWDDQWNCGHTAFLPLPHQLTIDLGTTVKLSRFKLYQRGGDAYFAHGNPKHFKIYGTLDINDLPPYDPQNPHAGWTLLKDCHSFKPSGLPLGQVTAEDIEYARKGEDFEFDVDNLVEVRYIRIENIESWGQEVTVIGELSFWGEITSQQQ